MLGARCNSIRIKIYYQTVDEFIHDIPYSIDRILPCGTSDKSRERELLTDIH